MPLCSCRYGAIIIILVNYFRTSLVMNLNSNLKTSPRYEDVRLDNSSSFSSQRLDETRAKYRPHFQALRFLVLVLHNLFLYFEGY
jgi:hypothetical protein